MVERLAVPLRHGPASDETCSHVRLPPMQMFPIWGTSDEMEVVIIYLCIPIYIYRERERERKRAELSSPLQMSSIWGTSDEMATQIYIPIYIYVYIYIYKEGGEKED